MIYHLAKDPDSYQRLFYQQIGLKHRDAKAPQNDWSDDEIGSIYTYGTMDTIFLLNFNMTLNICMPASSTKELPTLSLKIKCSSQQRHRLFLPLNTHAVA